MAYKKTNEAWFGDSFNRDSVMCSYAPMSGELTINSKGKITATDCGILDGAVYALNSVDSYGTIDFATSDMVETLGSKIESIRAQLDDLKKNFAPKTGACELRSALKTLAYKREVE